MGCFGVPTTQDLTKGCPAMAGPKIQANYRYSAMSIRNSSCDTNKWLIVDFVSPKV